MKIYYVKTNAYNSVLITDEQTAKDFSGRFYEGIDLYADNAAELLREHFRQVEKSGMHDYLEIGCNDEFEYTDDLDAELHNMKDDITAEIVYISADEED